MTRDQSIQWARKAGVISTKIDGIEAFAALAFAAGAAHEREECAKVCEELAKRLVSAKRTNQVDRHVADVLERRAEAIRARGKA